jgi:large subunit ribosomal protein L9
MDVILREDVVNLGAMGDVVKVRPGYGRNFLLPRGMAVVANKNNLRELEHQKRLVEDKRAREKKAAKSVADRIDGLVVEIKVHAGDEDRLYGSVTNMDIEKLLSDQGFAVDRRRIELAEPIKRLGTYRISITVAHDVRATITLKVMQQEGAA